MDKNTYQKLLEIARERDREREGALCRDGTKLIPRHLAQSSVQQLEILESKMKQECENLRQYEIDVRMQICISLVEK